MIGAWLRIAGARFDSAALWPYPWPPETAVAAAGVPATDWPALRTWCLADPSRWLDVAHAPASADASARAAALALHLDGSHDLHACGSAAQRLALRLRAKVQDVVPGRAARAGDIWDSGWVADEPAAWAALLRFQPRRATFMVMDGLPAARMQQALAAMHAVSSGYGRPVRVLVLGAALGRAL